LLGFSAFPSPSFRTREGGICNGGRRRARMTVVMIRYRWMDGRTAVGLALGEGEASLDHFPLLFLPTKKI
jgi:hypothetical protein